MDKKEAKKLRKKWRQEQRKEQKKYCARCGYRKELHQWITNSSCGSFRED